MNTAPPDNPLNSPEAKYAIFKELYFTTTEKQYSYGKWVLASLLTVHAGSLLAISQAGDATKRLYQACGPLLIYGVGLTLIAGGLAWINYTAAAAVYGRLVKGLREGNDFEIPGWVRFIVNLTLFGTPFIAIASLVLFFIAAGRATSIL
jgi:hypothetical protein